MKKRLLLNRKIIFAGVIAASMMTAMTGCGNKTENPSESSVVEEDPAKEMASEYENWGIKGLDLCKKETGIDGLTLEARLSKRAKTEKGIIRLDATYVVKNNLLYLMPAVFTGTEEQLDAYYNDYYGEGEYYDPEYYEEAETDSSAVEEDTVSEENKDAASAEEEETVSETDAEEEYVDYSSMYVNYITAIELTTGQIVREVELPKSQDGYYLYPEQKESGFVFSDYLSNGYDYIFYDYDLKSAKTISLKNGTTYGFPYYLEGFGFYFNQNGVLKFISLENIKADSEEDIVLESEAIGLEGDFRIDSICALYVDDEGHPCAVVDGIAGNLKQYRNCMFRLDTGELIKVDSDEGSYYYADGVLQHNIYSDDKYAIEIKGEDYDYVYKSVSTDFYPCLKVISGNKAVFYGEIYDSERDSYSIWMEIYDLNNGKLIDTLETETASDENFSMNYIETVFDFVGEDAIGFTISNSTSTDFYRWDFAEDENAVSKGIEVTVAEHDDGLEVDFSGEWDPTAFQPGECLEELSDLRARADELEQKFGFKIKLSNEANEIVSGYALVACNDRDTIATALDFLEQEASLYPDGFYNQLKGNGYTDIIIYMSGTIIGTEDSMLEYAGGFKTYYCGNLVLAIDISSPYSITTTLHHETGHAIQEYIQCMSTETFFEDEWKAYNPELEEGQDWYTYDYSRFGTGELSEYVYYDNGFDADTAWFVDDYSLTYPTEDIARIFENAMSADSSINYNECPHLKDKLNFLADNIRKYFDLPEEQMRWERFK